MDIVNCFRGYIDRALEAEGHICAPEVVVYRLGEGDDVQAFLFEQVGCFMVPFPPRITRQSSWSLW